MGFLQAETAFFAVIKIIKFFIQWKEEKQSLIPTDDSENVAEKLGKIGATIDKIFEDRTINFSDFPQIVEFLRYISAMTSINFEQAAHQIANASKSELEAVFKKFDEGFVLSDKDKEKNLEIIFHEIFNIVNSLAQIYRIVEKIK